MTIKINKSVMRVLMPLVHWLLRWALHNRHLGRPVSVNYLQYDDAPNNDYGNQQNSRHNLFPFHTQCTFFIFFRSYGPFRNIGNASESLLTIFVSYNVPA